MFTADALLRAPESDAEVDLQEEAEAYVEHITIPLLPAIPAKQMEDEVCANVREYCQSSWPKRDTIEVHS